ncbi:MAG: hypothetical protein J1F17_04150 [Oscillospiraceae bacterium]|nr:hypothetical protein [Oscillospiraceae bacterium]
MVNVDTKLYRKDFLNSPEGEHIFDEMVKIAKHENKQLLYKQEGETFDDGYYYIGLPDPIPEEELIKQALNEELSNNLAVLTQTDWIQIKVSEARDFGTEEEYAALKEKYAEEIEKRKYLRARNKQIEIELANLETKE